MIMKTTFTWLILTLLISCQALYGQPQQSGHNRSSCVAYYTARTDSLDPMIVHFKDSSTGLVANWMWSFGDGTFSDIPSPSHLFPGQGMYSVCLTISNADPLNPCWDKYCDTIYINIIPDCHAKFSAVLDTMNPEPNTFRFVDQSTGTPNSWLWLFGDDSVSTDQNTIHQYQSPGTYRVCLLIAKEDTSGVQCYDSICHNILTPEYYNLGGHLFAGEYPINNPVNTGDTGIALLYRMLPSKLEPVDTARFTHFGYFAFPQVLNGQYIIRAELTPGSSNYPHFFPSYFTGTLFWKSAEIISLTDSNVYTSNIYLITANDSLSGPASISGTIIHGGQDDLTIAPVHAEVILYNQYLEPLTFTMTEEDHYKDGSQFSFPALPFGTYNLQVESPGFYSRITTVTLDEPHPIAEGIILEIFDHDVTGIPVEPRNQSIGFGAVYPNPTDEKIRIEVISCKQTTLSIKIADLNGQIRYSTRHSIQKGRSMVQIPVSSFSNGMYFLFIHEGNGILLNVQKFLKY